MNNSAHESKIIEFPSSSQSIQAQNAKASLEDGYYRVANQIGAALCKVSLSSRESRLVQAVIMKTLGFNKEFDWICHKQLSDLTGIDISNISKVKSALIRRKILIVDGNKTGVNMLTSEWVLKPEAKPKKVSSDSKKVAKKESESTFQKVRIDSPKSQNRLKIESELTPTKENNITKDNITKDMSTTRKTKPPSFKDFFDQYPDHRKGGNDSHAWKTWKSEKLTEQDAVDALAWLTLAAQSDPGWRKDAQGQFVYGITRFIRERRWLAPVPIFYPSYPNMTCAPVPSNAPDFHSGDTSWGQDLGFL